MLEYLDSELLPLYEEHVEKHVNINTSNILELFE